MRIYAVGGCVRDQLLGAPVADRDWVVVGATPGEMLAAGFRPVGRDFPGLPAPADARGIRAGAHRAQDRTRLPRLRLPRRARRHARAGSGAARPDDQRDGARRGGRARSIPSAASADLEAKRLRHVGPAFAEDPVRILRVARFAARFAEFTWPTRRCALMRAMVQAGEVDALVPERVWQELARGLMEARPSRMFEVLRDCGALARLLPELDALWGVPQRADVHPRSTPACT
jgi:tRNA nucleotidyltransferase (CCA-adding enzyme)